jgi:hypothetical protein
MSAAQPSYLVQILLPKQTGSGKAVEQKWFDSLLKELTNQFGGVTSFLRAPSTGLWQNGQQVEEDNIAVIEVMTRDLDPAYWASLRGRLEHDLSQEEIVIRAEEIMRL